MKLASNENPLAPSDRVQRAVIAALGGLNRYPDGSAFYLRQALAKKHGVAPEQILLGNGSNELIELIARSFLRPGDEAVVPQPSFVAYPMIVQAVGAVRVVVELRDYRLDLEGMARALTAATKLVFVANPNNPDRTRAVGQPAAVEALVSSAFSLWWLWVHDDSPVWAMTTMADEFTGGFLDFGIHHSSQEPRVAWNNTSTFTYRTASQDPWYGLHQIVSNVNDALIAMNNLALLYRNQDQFDKAEPLFVKILEIAPRVLPENDPRRVAFMNNLGTLYQSKEEYDKAEPPERLAKRANRLLQKVKQAVAAGAEQAARAGVAAEGLGGIAAEGLSEEIKVLAQRPPITPDEINNKLLERVILPKTDKGNVHVYNQFTVRAQKRDELRAYLKDKGIGTEIYYPIPLHLQECFAYLGCSRGDLPQSEAAADETIALPIYPELTSEQLDHVANSIIKFVGSHAQELTRSAGLKSAGL